MTFAKSLLVVSAALIIAACAPGNGAGDGGSSGSSESGGSAGQGVDGRVAGASGSSVGQSAGGVGEDGRAAPGGGSLDATTVAADLAISSDVDGASDAAVPPSDAGPAKFWSCPAGPFAAPKAGPSHAVCDGFAFKYGWNEGPTWVAGQNAFFFSNFVEGGGEGGAGDMIKFTPSTGACEVFIDGDGCNGLAAAPDGNIIAVCQKTRAVMKFDVTTKQGTVLAAMSDGMMLDSPNDVVTHRNGTIYFTNPPNDLGGRPVGFGSALMRIDPTGVLSTIMRGGVNGLAISPDEKRLYVVYQGVWDLDDQGAPLKKEGAFPLGNDGLAVDCAGNVYDQSGSIHNAQGGAAGRFPGGTNMAFGGPDAKTLLVVNGKSAHTVEMNLPGLPF